MGRSKSTLNYVPMFQVNFRMEGKILMATQSVRMDLGRIRSGRESVHVLFKESSLN